jgi:hypothetical protein
VGARDRLPCGCPACGGRHASDRQGASHPLTWVSEARFPIGLLASCSSSRAHQSLNPSQAQVGPPDLRPLPRVRWPRAEVNAADAAKAESVRTWFHECAAAQRSAPDALSGVTAADRETA